MIPVWEHFEDLEEILYVADVETYELVYLNRYGRSVFRIEWMRTTTQGKVL